MFLVARARKAVRKPATGEARRDLGVNARRATNDRDRRARQKKQPRRRKIKTTCTTRRQGKFSPYSMMQGRPVRTQNRTRFAPSFVLTVPATDARARVATREVDTTVEPRPSGYANALHMRAAQPGVISMSSMSSPSRTEPRRHHMAVTAT